MYDWQQGVTLLAVGPFMDKMASGSWVHNYLWSRAALTLLLLSCACAILVNLSQVACLGRFSALSFQVTLLLRQSMMDAYIHV